MTKSNPEVQRVKLRMLVDMGLTQIEHGRTLYQEYLRTDGKLRFIINLSIDDFASMQVYAKIKEDLSKTA